MFKKVALTLLLMVFSLPELFSQTDSSFHRVPKQISFEAGYRNLFVITDRSVTPYVNSTTHGVGFLFDYGWKLSGLNAKKPGVYLTVPIGYTALFANDNSSKRISMLNYGWTIRHDLSVHSPIQPFIGYGLFLNTLSVLSTEGSVMGHQTQFEGGLNFRNSSLSLRYFVKLQCSYTSYPRLGEGKRIHLMFADVRAGVRL